MQGSPTSSRFAHPAFDLSGGALCLDFVNTVSDRLAPAPIERLESYRDLLSWSVQAGAVPAERASALARLAAGRPAAAAAALAAARRLRETLFRLLSAVAAGDAPAADDLAALNAALATALRHLRLTASGPAAPGFTWSWAGGEALDAVLWPVARSAAELLTGAERALLRACAATSCAWLFLDRSRNRSRRWCDMKVCGNRSKARRHYARRRRR